MHELTEPRASHLRLWVGGFLLLIYGSIVIMATMWPTPLDRGYEQSIERVLDVLHRNGVPRWFDYSTLEFSANIALFVPVGFLVALLLPFGFWWLALLICPALSVAIELTQGLFLAARFATLSDVSANSIGAVLGVLAAIILRALVRQRDQKVVARALWADRSKRAA
ncbi:hypothetical protein BH09ACT6_BH09ACT6_20250 [soil metagenome]